MIRRPAALLLALCTLAGCQSFGGEPAIGEQLADGSVLLNRGRADGQPWSVTASRRDDRICLSIEAGGATSEASCAELAPRQPGGVGTSQGVMSGPEMPTVIEGITGPAVERIVLETAAGSVNVPVVPLTALGVSAKGYAVGLPPNVAATRLVHFDAAGNELTDFVP